ncbi:MAG: hypothetical protein AVDCRST_MAG45-594, partial [uncultured Solirubrobacterales bacterium]
CTTSSCAASSVEPSAASAPTPSTTSFVTSTTMPSSGSTATTPWAANCVAARRCAGSSSARFASSPTCISRRLPSSRAVRPGTPWRRLGSLSARAFPEERPTATRECSSCACAGARSSKTGSTRTLNCFPRRSRTSPSAVTMRRSLLRSGPCPRRSSRGS